MKHLSLICNLSPLSDVVMYQISPISCSVQSITDKQSWGVSAGKSLPGRILLCILAHSSSEIAPRAEIRALGRPARWRTMKNFWFKRGARK